MIAATQPVQRPPDAKLLYVRGGTRIEHRQRSRLVELLRPGDLVVANDAATLPASLSGTHIRTGRSIEVRLAGRESLDPEQVNCFVAVVFGAGDFRKRTEDRPPPPALLAGDRLQLGPLVASVVGLQGHPRLVSIRFVGSARAIWAGLARHGKPIQYAHIRSPLALWDTWTPIAGTPAAFEPPSAGFALSWEMLRTLRERGVGFATVTHSAGISSTGDTQLDDRLPFDEPYRIPITTAESIATVKGRNGRVIAVGTTVVRALEDAALDGGLVREGHGVARHKVNAATRLRVVDAILSGTHSRGTSHFELLRAFLSTRNLTRMEQELEQHGYRTHEFGDSILVEKAPVAGT